MTQKPTPHHPVDQQQGRTLIELLVAIGLGLLILLGVGSLFLGANQSSRVASNIASTEETGQIVLATIGRAIQRAGYAEIVGSDLAGRMSRNALLYRGVHVQGCTGASFQLTGGGAPVIDANGLLTCDPSPPAGATDSLAVAFQADSVIGPAQGPTLDCLGQAPALEAAHPDYAGDIGGATPGQVPIVRNLYDLALPAGNLRCRGSGNPTAPQTLMGNVEDLKIFFGFDDAGFTAVGGNLPPVASSFRDAAFIRSQTALSAEYSPWDFVVSVYVCVLVASQDQGVAAQGAATQHLPCPQTAGEVEGATAISPVTGPGDGRVRRAYSQVFALRSRTAPAPINL